MDDIFERIALARREGREAMLVTVVEKEGSAPAPPGTKMLVYADGASVGTVGGGAVERLATAKALELLAQRQSLFVRYALLGDEQVSDSAPTGMICGGKMALFYEYLGYETRVYVFGAGHVGRAIARHLGGSGLQAHPYYVTVVDEREGLIHEVPGANRLILAGYATVFANEPPPEGGYFVIATPGHASDYTMLKRIYASGWKPRYVGMLGSRRKVEGLVQRLRAELGEGVNLSTLYSPVGLDLGGSSPDEIAIAIVAEIQALRYGKTGQRHMRITG